MPYIWKMPRKIKVPFSIQMQLKKLPQATNVKLHINRETYSPMSRGFDVHVPENRNDMNGPADDVGNT
ncbi:hypothetical protein C5167_018247 [Papaver somniferum]|uniref:Uncharacterized protein n=1 Tax=Papaver somniferum TaxID=3469 RepID=A0A4Y7INX3_PAPSO|nr:hypothetical protein C5167_018247 [Papaver somniferum]